MSLKIKFPDQVHLLRGSHEDRNINKLYGFGEECKNRLSEDITEAESAFGRINDMFEWLPLVATIDKRICCLHSGIGSSTINMEEIESLKRPIVIS
jgi:hypothetical protein